MNKYVLSLSSAHIIYSGPKVYIRKLKMYLYKLITYKMLVI